jgi:glycosyltransferase involved in cell wall biosynthesis
VFTRRQMPRTFWLENWLASRAATRMIAVSHAVARALRRKGTPKRKLNVVYNGLVTARVDRPVSEQERETWRGRIGWSADRPTLGIVSRPKEQAVVLQSLAHVETPVRLVLAGVGESPALRSLATRTPWHEVVFLPFDPDIRPLYDMLDLVLLPTRMEGLSQALLEAMALGLPVIASETTSNPEVIRDGQNGCLVEHGDPAAWARAITGVLADPEKARGLGEAARHTAREDFSLAKTVEGTLGVYGGVVGERRPVTGDW